VWAEPTALRAQLRAALAGLNYKTTFVVKRRKLAASASQACWLNPQPWCRSRGTCGLNYKHPFVVQRRKLAARASQERVG